MVNYIVEDIMLNSTNHDVQHAMKYVYFVDDDDDD
jgi:hypothetical protein